MAFLVKSLFRWNKCSKNANISILSNFLAMFLKSFFSISRNFTKYYLHAKFQINWIIQTEITEGAESPPPPPPYQSANKPGLFGVKWHRYYKFCNYLQHKKLNLPPICDIMLKEFLKCS